MEGIAESDALLVREFEYEGYTCRIAEFRDYLCGYIQLTDPEGVTRKYIQNFLDEPPVGGINYGVDGDGWTGFTTNHPESKNWGIEETREEIESTVEKLARYEKLAEQGTKESPAPEYGIEGFPRIRT